MKVNCDLEGITQAANAVNGGKVIIFPTDTVYGIGCDPFNKKAVEEIFRIKQRDAAKSLPVLGYSKNELESIVELNELHEKIITQFWPGPLTIIGKIKNEKLKDSLNLSEKIAVRVPNNECILEILKKCKLLVGTSANISGQKSFVEPEEYFEQFKDIPVFVDGGKIISSGESTIIELIENEVKILREGKITKEEIQKIL